MRAIVVDLVDYVFKTNYISSNILLNLSIWLYMNSFLTNFAMQLFVNQLWHQLLWRFSPSYVVFHLFQQSDVFLRSLNKNSSIDLFEVQFRQNDFLWSWDICNSSNSDSNQHSSNTKVTSIGIDFDLLVVSILNKKGETLSR